MVKTFGLVALAAVAALVLGFGSHLTSSTPKASADTTGVSVVGCELLASAIDGTTEDATVPGDYVVPCAIGGAFFTPADITNIANAIGDKDGVLEKSDLDSLDQLDGNQIPDACDTAAEALPDCTLDVFVFVDDEQPVTIDPPAGLITLETGNNLDFICNTDGASLTTDDDCSQTIPNNGDGVVVFHLLNGTANPGDTVTVTVKQETVDQNFDVNIVGGANNITLTLIEGTIGSSGSSAAMNTCATDSDVADTSSITAANSTLAYVVATDADDTKLTRVPVVIGVSPSSANNNIVALGVGSNANGVVGNTGQTVDPETAGAPTAQYVVICGGKSTGTATITASIVANTATGTVADSASADIDVVGLPAAVALAAAPAQIQCNGTASSTVTATVTDTDGNNVADGTDVTFSVVALGTANPIKATTTAGVATSVITPLSNSSAGVTVIVTAGNNDAQSSILVACSLPLATQPTAAPPVVAPTARVGIGGPDTGTGGYLGQDDSGFSMWTLVVIALGTLTLVGGATVARRAGK